MTELFTYETAKQIMVHTAYYLNWVCTFWELGYTMVSICRLIWLGIRKTMKKIRENHKELLEKEL